MQRGISAVNNPSVSLNTITSIILQDISFIQLDGGGQRVLFVADSNKSALRWIDYGSKITSATAGTFLLDVGSGR